MKDNYVTDSQVVEFYSRLSNYGYSDIVIAIKKFDEVGLETFDLTDIVREYIASTGITIDEIDVCHVAYGHILQTARNKLNEVLHFDIIDDIKGGYEEFNILGSHTNTSYDYSDEAKDQLESKLKSAEQEQIVELLEDKLVRVFLEDVDIDIDNAFGNY